MDALDAELPCFVLAELLVLCLSSAAIGLALSAILLPAVPYTPLPGLSAPHIVGVAAVP